MDKFGKITFLNSLLRHKEKLFDTPTNKVSWEEKQQIWAEVYQECVDSGCSGLVNVDHLRKTTWQNLQRRARARFERFSSGASSVPLSEIDQLVIAIIGENDGVLANLTADIDVEGNGDGILDNPDIDMSYISSGHQEQDHDETAVDQVFIANNEKTEHLLNGKKYLLSSNDDNDHAYLSVFDNRDPSPSSSNNDQIVENESEDHHEFVVSKQEILSDVSLSMSKIRGSHGASSGLKAKIGRIKGLKIPGTPMFSRDPRTHRYVPSAIPALQGFRGTVTMPNATSVSDDLSALEAEKTRATVEKIRAEAAKFRAETAKLREETAKLRDERRLINAEASLKEHQLQDMMRN